MNNNIFPVNQYPNRKFIGIIINHNNLMTTIRINYPLNHSTIYSNLFEFVKTIFDTFFLRILVLFSAPFCLSFPPSFLRNVREI